MLKVSRSVKLSTFTRRRRRVTQVMFSLVSVEAVITAVSKLCTKSFYADMLFEYSGEDT